jgi:hypothetical protein
MMTEHRGRGLGNGDAFKSKGQIAAAKELKNLVRRPARGAAMNAYYEERSRLFALQQDEDEDEDN